MSTAEVDVLQKRAARFADYMTEAFSREDYDLTCFFGE